MQIVYKFFVPNNFFLSLKASFHLRFLSEVDHSQGFMMVISRMKFSEKFMGAECGVE